MIIIILLILLQTPRHTSIAVQFMKLTGYPHGREGYVIDHIVPLCAGGPDTIANLKWQLKKESYIKDKFERELCAAMKKENLIIVKKELVK